MSKKNIITIGVIVTILIVGVVAYIFVPKNSTVPNSPSTSSSPSVIQNSSNKEKNIEENMKENEAKNVASVDEKKVSTLEGFSSKELKEATEFLTKYSYSTFGNSYFMGGEWVKNGFKVKELTDYMNAFYSYKIINEISQYEGKQGTPEFIEKMTSLMPYFGDTENYSPSKYCSADYGTKLDETGKVIETNEIVDEPLIDCASDLKISEIKFTSIKDKESYYLKAEFSVEAKLALYSKELEQDAQTTAKYDYNLRLEENIAEDGSSEWEITGYKIKPSMSNIHALDTEGSNE